jgi:hypothetical protein
MKHLVVMGALIACAAVAHAQTQPAGKKAAGTTADAGHAAPKQQPSTAPAPNAPTGAIALGTVHLAKAVKADGKPLKAGTYQLRLTTEQAQGDAKGATAGLERWVEFVQGGKVQGREVATIIPQSEVGTVQKDTPPKANTAKVEMLKGGDFVRVWVNKGGTHYLVYLPPAA